MKLHTHLAIFNSDLELIEDGRIKIVFKDKDIQPKEFDCYNFIIEGKSSEDLIRGLIYNAALICSMAEVSDKKITQEQQTDRNKELVKRFTDKLISFEV